MITLLSIKLCKTDCIHPKAYSFTISFHNDSKVPSYQFVIICSTFSRRSVRLLFCNKSANKLPAAFLAVVQYCATGQWYFAIWSGCKVQNSPAAALKSVAYHIFPINEIEVPRLPTRRSRRLSIKHSCQRLFRLAPATSGSAQKIVLQL